jgi:hypothetical protein
MEWKSIAAVTVVVLTIPGTAVAQGLSPAAASLTVRTYNNYGVRVDDLRAARMHVDGILQEAGIGLSWLDCWYRDKEPAEAPPQCREPLGANELTLRLQAPSPRSTKGYVSMGFSLVNGEGVPFLATVFVDLVASISAGAAVDFRLLLGRAIAHEIGHLLLDSARHADHGLMRAAWSRADLQRNRAADWAFRDTEIATMQRAAMSRSVRWMASNP